MDKVKYKRRKYYVKAISSRGAYMTAIISRFGKRLEVPLEQLEVVK